MEKPTLFILCGPAFSGKTTIAKKIKKHYGAKLIGRDAIRFAIEDILAFESTPEEDGNSLWKNLWPLMLQCVKNQLIIGNSVVVDDNCLYLRQRDELRAIAKKAKAKIILIYLNVPLEILKERKEKNKISKERHDVHGYILEEDARTFERPTQEEKPITYAPEDSMDILFSKLEKII